MASGSYTGTSSNGSFNPASYTRHFMGSPVSWRPGSLGFGGRMFASGSPMDQLLGSIDPMDSRFNPSSAEAHRGSILNALSVFDPTDEIARNYACCGIILNDMHDLLEHFETIHVVIDPNFPEGQRAHLRVPFNPQPAPTSGTGQPRMTPAPVLPPTAMLPIHQQNQMVETALQQQLQYPGSFDSEDMDIDIDIQQSFPQTVSSQSSPSSGAPTPPDTPVSTPLSAYPSPSLYDSPKSLLSLTQSTGAEQYSQPTSPLASQPPSPHSYEADGGPAVAFETFSARPQTTRSTSSLDGALAGTTTSLQRPHLNITLTPFSSRPSPSSGHPGALNALNPYARYAAHCGMPGTAVESKDSVGIDAGNVGGEYQPGETSPVKAEKCVPPALLFSNAPTPESTPSTSRVPSPTQVASKKSGSGKQPPSASGTASPSSASASSSAMRTSSSLARATTTSLLLSKPFKCPKPNCNKSYKQANGLKYHITHGSCNFAPPKDLEHVQALLERKRRDKAAAEGVTLPEGEHSTDASPSGSGVNSPLSQTFPDFDQISEADLREVEIEAEKRFKPFACTVGDCTRRYKNMNGLRYHYQHTGEHGAIGLGLLASGQHECLKSNMRADGSGSRDGSIARDGAREGRKLKLTLGKSSKPSSRAPSTGRADVQPQQKSQEQVQVQTQVPQTPQTPSQQLPPQTPQFTAAQPTAAVAPTVYATNVSSTSSSLSGTNSLANVNTQIQAALAYQQRYMDHQRAQFAQQQQLDQQQQLRNMQAQFAAMQNGMYTSAPVDASMSG